MTDETPKILVEGGPDQRRKNALLAVLVGCVIGLIGGVTYTAIRLGDVAHRNCSNIGTLANIERVFIAEQQARTRGLLERGITFGIPKEQLPALIAASERSEETFLDAFDRLRVGNC